MKISGKAYWASVHKLKVSKPDAQFYKEPHYIISVVPDAESIKALEALEINGYKVKLKESNKNIPGKYVEVKANEKFKNGTARPSIPVVDKHKNRITDNIGNGSLVNVSCNPASHGLSKEHGLSLWLNAVQVIDLVAYSGIDEFDNFDDNVADF